MKLLLNLLLVLVLPFIVNAQTEVPDLPSSVIYKKDLRKKATHYPSELDKAIEEFSFLVLKGQGRTVTINALDSVDRIYIPKHSKSSKLIIAKSGIQVEGPFQYGQIYNIGSGYIVHLNSSTSGDISFFFEGFELRTIKDISQRLKETLKGTSSVSRPYVVPRMYQQILSHLFPHAVAAENAEDLCRQNFKEFTSKSIDNDPTESPSNLQKLWSCTKGFAGGAWNATGGGVWVLVKGTYQAVAHPIETFNRASEEFKKMKALIADISGAFGEMKDAFSALPSDVKIQIGCEIVSSVGVTALIAFFTAGAGSPALMRALASAAQKVAGLLPPGGSVGAKVSMIAGKMRAKASNVEASLKEVAENKDLVRQSKKELAIVDPPRTNYGSEWSPIKIKNFLADKEFMEVLKKEQPEIVEEIYAAAANQNRADELRAIKAAAEKIIKDNRTSAKNKALISARLGVGLCMAAASANDSAQNNIRSSEAPGAK